MGNAPYTTWIKSFISSSPGGDARNKKSIPTIIIQFMMRAPSPASSAIPLAKSYLAAAADALRLPSPGTSIPTDGFLYARSRMRAARRWARPS